MLKDNIPEMTYYDYMAYAKANGVQIASKDELLMMYLQRDQINKILKAHNGDRLNKYTGSSTWYDLSCMWDVHLVTGRCTTTYKDYEYVSRAVIGLKKQK